MNGKSKEIKTNQQLMKHMVDNGYDVNSQDSLFLKYNGYYSFYKGCRYINENKVNNMQTIKILYDFDTELKRVLYTPIIKLEKIIKNLLIYSIANSPNYAEAYYTTFIDKCTIGQQEKVKYKTEFHNTCYKNIDNKKISHYLLRDEEVPIWAYFDILTIGQLSYVYSSFPRDIKSELSKELKILTGGSNPSYDTNYEISKTILLLIHKIRNAVMHDDIIFDTRFYNKTINHKLEIFLKDVIDKTNNYKFDTILDYILIALYILNTIDEAEFKKTHANIVRLFEQIEQFSPGEKSLIFKHNYENKINNIKNMI